MQASRSCWFFVGLCAIAILLALQATLVGGGDEQSVSLVLPADLVVASDSLATGFSATGPVVPSGAALPMPVDRRPHSRRGVTAAPVLQPDMLVPSKAVPVQYVKPIGVPAVKKVAATESLPLVPPDSTPTDRQREIIRALLLPETNNDSEAADENMSMNPAARDDRFDDKDTIESGRQAFDSSCTQCHEAERALSKSKSLASWLATVRRMAAKDDADIAAGDMLSIATYLASLRAPADGEAQADNSAAGSGGDSVSFFGTISTVWRGTDGTVENKGFFPDVWIGTAWQGSGPVSGRVMACTSCHGDNQGLGVELVEANIRLDLIHLLTDCKPEERDECALEARVKAGRFIVPFGAFAAMSHPGVYRTVSNPLMFNMGRRVGSIDVLQPVIPMPYADEGVDVSLKKPIWGDLTATFDAYAVNGLQVGGSEVFLSSRSYRDNNSNLAVGGRGTIGNRYFKIGGSVMSGELQPDGDPLKNYRLFGGDVTVRYEDFVRAYFEYAVRRENPFFGFDGAAKGTVVEGELRVWNEPRIGLLARYDTLQHKGISGTDSIYRFTSGVNISLPGGSLLLINHERWVFTDRQDTNILGLRWTATF